VEFGELLGWAHWLCLLGLLSYHWGLWWPFFLKANFYYHFLFPSFLSLSLPPILLVLPLPIFLSFLFLDNTGIWTQGLVLARQVLYYLSNAPALFASAVFWIGSHISASDWSVTSIFLPVISHTKNTDEHHHVQLMSWGGGETTSLTFCPGWPGTEILPISASQIAGVTGLYHYGWPFIFFLFY
jgi:hypothetical protein